MRHAGARNVAGAFYTRLQRRAGRTALGRYFAPPVKAVTDADVLNACGGSLDQFLSEEHSRRHFLHDAQRLAKSMHPLVADSYAVSFRRASEIFEGRFHFLGKDAAFGDTIDWHWCPETGGSWPILPSHEYTGVHSYYRDDRPGDVKYPWELNRHQYFFTIAKCYARVRDDLYVDMIVDQVTDWLEKNPYRVGMNWVSAMEVGIRLISWCNAFWLIKDSEAFRARGLQPMIRGMYQHALHLDRHLTTDWLVRNNHILGETAGLFLFAVLFPQFRESTRWRRKALRIFSNELQAQIFSDGVNKEQATGYHRFVVDFVLLVLRVGELNKISMPKMLYTRLKQMLKYEHALIAPDGRVPQVGDCDDGRGFIFDDAQDFFDYRPWQTAGAKLFGRADFAEAGVKSEEYWWWRGLDGLEEMEEETEKRFGKGATSPALEACPPLEGPGTPFEGGKEVAAAAKNVAHLSTGDATPIPPSKLARLRRGGVPASSPVGDVAPSTLEPRLTYIPVLASYFPEGGQAILRSGGEYLHLRCGPFGLGGDGASAHSHADMLSPVIYWAGQPLVVDPGTYAYLCDTEWRDRFRSTAMHNTVGPRGLEQAPLFPLKDWGVVPRTELLEWDGLDMRIRARMTFSHVVGQGPPYVERSFSLAEGRLVIEDVVVQPEVGPVDCWFHLAPDLAARVEGNAVIIENAGASLARLVFDGYHTAEIKDSWHSPRYGVKVPAKAIRLTATGREVRGTCTFTGT
ncbi:MAG: alginate lyase family protein [Candidatus Hydrogenedentes bacterium]|nr:alginate lyase family protein [Candidatus Hydrogenedentota bacterium]